MSACFSLDLEVFFSLDLVSTEVLLVLAVPRALEFFLWQFVLSIFENYIKPTLYFNKINILLIYDSLLTSFQHMKEEQKISHQICPNIAITLDQTIFSLLVVIHCRKTSNFLPTASSKSEDVALSLEKSEGVFWLLKRCMRDQELEFQEIQRLLGLSVTTICVDLPNSLQTLIEKTFGKIQNEMLSSAQGNKLIFVKDIYKEKQSVSDTKYFDTFEKAKTYVFRNNNQITNPIQVADLLQLYDCQLPTNVPKVKAIHCKYLHLRNKQLSIAKSNSIIFDQSRPKSVIQSEISEAKLSKQYQGKLIWKLEQMHRYRAWIEEEQDKGATNKLKKLTFNDLDDSIDYRTALKHQQEWSRNSFQLLKKLFSKISNSKDTTNIKDFQKEYKTMKNNLQNLIQETPDRPEHKIYINILEELEVFYKYHNKVIEGQTLSSLTFIQGEASYLWKYQNNFYKKMAVFFLLGGLGYLQNDYIWGFTLLILAVLTLTLRC